MKVANVSGRLHSRPRRTGGCARREELAGWAADQPDDDLLPEAY